MHTYSPFAPMPYALDTPSNPAHRRVHIARHELAPRTLDSFNELRSELDPHCTPLAPDQLATAARNLCRAGLGAPDCVVQRLNGAFVGMRAIRDTAWQTPEPVIAVLRRVVGYLRTHDDLIPDALPTIGRLDDALVIDAAWPLLADEIVAYRDYRALRAWLRAMQPARAKTFDRSAWLDLRRTQADSKRQARAVRDSTYLAPRRTSFLVH